MDRLEQLERARARARGVRLVKLAGQDRYLAREPDLRTRELLRAMDESLALCPPRLPRVHLSGALQAR
jgi:hypothetical protein